jgi:hypothetical protein
LVAISRAAGSVLPSARITNVETGTMVPVAPASDVPERDRAFVDSGQATADSGRGATSFPAAGDGYAGLLLAQQSAIAEPATTPAWVARVTTSYQQTDDRGTG